MKAKTTKTLGMMLLVLAMLLAACGAKPAETASASKETEETSVSESSASEEEATSESSSAESASAEEATSESGSAESTSAEEATSESSSAESASAEEATSESTSAESSSAESASAEEATSESSSAESASAEDATSESTSAEEATSASDAERTMDAIVADVDLSFGAVAVDDMVFILGTPFSAIKGSAWTLNPEDEEKYADYSLNPWTTSGSAMGVYSDEYGREYDSFHVMVSLMNASDDPIAYLDGAIDYLNMPGLNRVERLPNVVLPRGLTLTSTEEEFIAAYGEPTYEYEDAETEYRMVEFRDEEVKLQVTWSKGVMSDILMTI